MNQNLVVNVVGDASGFNKTMSNVKASASQLNNDLARQQQKQVVAGAARFASSAGKAAGLAGLAAGVPGMGKAGQAVSGAAMAFIGLKEGALMLKMSMVSAAAHLGVFAAAVIVGQKIWDEGNKAVAALKEETLTAARAHAARKTTLAKYDKTIDDNARALGAGNVKRLKLAIRSSDDAVSRAAFKEIQSKFGGTESNKELQKMVAKGRIEAMPKGVAKSIAEENWKFNEEREKLREKIGDKPSQATAALARQLYSQMNAEYNNRIAEILQQQLKEQREIKANTKVGNPFQ